MELAKKKKRGKCQAKYCARDARRKYKNGGGTRSKAYAIRVVLGKEKKLIRLRISIIRYSKMLKEEGWTLN